MKLTSHARDRMTEMDVDADEVYAVLRDPQITYVSDRHLGLGDRQLVCGGRLALVVEGKKVVTVLWHGRGWFRRDQPLDSGAEIDL